MSKERGRKIGKVTFKLKTGDLVSVDLRLAQRNGLQAEDEFIAETHGTEVRAGSLDALRAELAKVANAAMDITWSRVIKISYHGRAGRESQGVDPDDDEDAFDPAAITELSIDWEVWDVSSPFGDFEARGWYQGRDRPRVQHRIWRKVTWDEEDRTWSGSARRDEHQDWHGEWDAGVVPFTEERVEVLRQVQRALGEAHRRILGLFRGSVDQVAAQLDGIARLDRSRLDGFDRLLVAGAVRDAIVDAASERPPEAKPYASGRRGGKRGS